jgi:MYXO-CTERM domain-containing protein
MLGLPAYPCAGATRDPEGTGMGPAWMLSGVRVDRLSAAEPTTWLLVVIGLLALAVIRRRRV